MSYCLICNKELTTFNQIKFCSRECYYKSKLGSKRPEVGKKIASSLKGHPHTEERKNNISKAKKEGSIKKWDILTEKDIIKIENVLTEGYSSTLKNIMIASRVNKGYRSLFYYIQKHKDWFHSFILNKYNPTEVQQWDVIKWREFKLDLTKLTVSAMCVKYSFLERKLLKLCERNHLSFPLIDTKPIRYSQMSQKLFWDIYNILPNELKENTYFAELNMEIRHKIYNLPREFFGIKNKEYSFDFCIIYNNVVFIIEFNGDCFHANPKFYKEDDCPSPFHPVLTSKEIWNKDKGREDYVVSLGGMFLTVWEHEYHSSKQEVMDDIQMYLNMVYYSNENKNLRSFG